MTKKISPEVKALRLWQSAMVATDNGASRRDAAKIARLPLSTFQYRLHNQSREQTPRTVLTPEEEGRIVELITEYSDQGFPLRRTDLAQAVQIFVKSLPVERQLQIPFKDGLPGIKFLRLFTERHRDKIKYGRSSRQEEVRWKATNATTLTKHFAALEDTIRKHNISPSRIANIDETGTTAANDCVRSSKTKTYGTRGRLSQQRSPEFTNVKRITMLPVIFANGSKGSSLFVIEGTKVKYRKIKSGRVHYIETLSECLPRNSYSTTREDVASVDGKNFLEWSKYFVQDIIDLTSNDKKVLLILDGYRSHMSYAALDVLKQGGVIVYALPAHTSGTTQPLDIGVFGPFKEHLRNSFESISTPSSTNVYDVFDYLKLMREAYHKSFTLHNIQSGFAKTGIWPLDPTVLLSVPRPLSADQSQEIMSTKDMRRLLEEKKVERRQNIGIQPVVTASGFIDTTCGAILTSTEAMRLAYQRYLLDKAKAAAKNRNAAAMAEKQQLYREKVRAERLRHEGQALAYRMHHYGVANVKPRSLAVRRQIAKKRKAMLIEQHLAQQSLLHH